MWIALLATALIAYGVHSRYRWNRAQFYSDLADREEALFDHYREVGDERRAQNHGRHAIELRNYAIKELQ